MPAHPRNTHPDLYEQYPDLYHEYPEIARDIYAKIDQHGEEWVLENWYSEYLQAGVLFDVPDKEELPFFHPEEHDAWSDEERAQMARAYSTYRETLKNASEED